MDNAGEGSNQTLVDKAYNILRDEIIQGELRSGDPLLEQEIADRLNMSRTPVRSAIERLKHDGLVETVKRKGMLVKPLSTSAVEQAYEVAEGLEGMVAKLAAERASPEQIEDLLVIVREMSRAAERDDMGAWVRCDREFHLKLLEMARNPMIAAELERVQTVVDRVRFLYLGLGAALTSSREHMATAEAIAARDGEHARQLHQAHWNRVREQIVSFLTTRVGREVLTQQVIERALRMG